MSEKFKKALQFTLKWEGGYSNHVSDLGGKTNYGVTQETFSNWLIRKNQDANRSVSRITKEEAEAIYFEFWENALCEELVEPLAITHFDTAVNFGVAGAFEFLKDVIGEFKEFDKAIEKHNNIKTAIAICNERIKYRHQRVKQKPSQQVFLQGWLNRDNDLLKYIQNMKNDILRIENDSWLKIKPLSSERLTEREKLSIKQGDRLPVISISEERGHYKFRLEKPQIDENIWYYVYIGHSRLERPEADIPKKVCLDVVYKSQLDNIYNPTGSCNVTSYAMVLEHLGVKAKHYAQLEDELYAYMTDKGLSRHNPYDLAQMGRNYGFKVDFKEFAKIEEIQEWLATEAKPVVIHGWFTGFGHIVTIVGYDSNNFIVHDPYGEWFSTGYRTDLSGAYLNYSYTLIRDKCIESNGSFWVHFISN